MNPPLLLDNLLAWSAQICVLAAVGALAALTLKHPRARLIFWQGILAIALLLPAIEPWAQPAPDSSDGVAATTSTVTIPRAPVRHAVQWKREYLLGLVAAGSALRMLWIAAGFVRLRRHRLAAHALANPPVPFERANVRWYLSDTVSGPVTFGWLRPSILLPARINQFPDDLREAIACHELIHVRRRDWLFVLAEELIRGLFWFHPAIWFVLSRIQLAREQVVDSEVVRLTRDRERYLDALLAVAAHRLLPDVAPAPLFLKKRQLAVRVAAVLKETTMSKSRLVASLTTVCSAAIVAARLAVWFFPLQSPAQSLPEARISVAQDGAGITVDPGGKLMHRTPVFYPRGAKAAGAVMLEASLNSKGEVTDVRVLSGPEELRKGAIQSVLQWHYATDAGVSPTVQVSIRFDQTLAEPKFPAAIAVKEKSIPRVISETPSVIKSIEFIGTPPEIEQKVRGILPVREGDQMMPDTISKVGAAAREVDEHFRVGSMNNNLPDHRETILHISLAAPPLPPPPPAPYRGVGIGVGTGVGDGVSGGVAGGVSDGVATAGPVNSQRIRVGGNVQAANLISKVTPAYPPAAKEARIQGTVRFSVIVGKDGTVENVELMSGHPLLASAALEAVRQWVYRPVLLNGQPVEVITQVDVNFTLSQ